MKSIYFYVSSSLTRPQPLFSQMAAKGEGGIRRYDDEKFLAGHRVQLCNECDDNDYPEEIFEMLMHLDEFRGDSQVEALLERIFTEGFKAGVEYQLRMNREQVKEKK